MESTLDSVNKAEEMADKVAAQAGIDEDTRSGVSMAVREAMINAVLHGNNYDPAKRVNLTLEQNGKELIVTITDEGSWICAGRGSRSACPGEPIERIRPWHILNAGIHG